MADPHNTQAAIEKGVNAKLLATFARVEEENSFE
jgi:hypothetical protein